MISRTTQTETISVGFGWTQMGERKNSACDDGPDSCMPYNAEFRLATTMRAYGNSQDWGVFAVSYGAASSGVGCICIIGG